VIIETIVTTLDPGGQPHFAAMGVVWDEATVTIRPYLATRTYRHLAASREAVVNVTDDVLLFARSALTHDPLPCGPARHVRGVVLRGACHWREVAVEEIRVPEAAGPGARRADVLTRVVGRGEIRPFAGLCRAKHAVVEASILASRARLLPPGEVRDELDRLDVLVDKTGGHQEREAMAFIRGYLARRIADGRPGARRSAG
jgi:hypothetical protein